MTHEILGNGKRKNKILDTKIVIDLSKEDITKPERKPTKIDTGKDSDIIYVPSENHMTYFSGLQYLQQHFVAEGNIHPTITHDGKIIPVALSLEEILKARILGYKNGTTEEEKLKLFNLYFWTGDGIAYKKKTPSELNPPFKLIGQSKDLGLLDANKTHIEKDYSKVKGTELQRDNSYGKLLTEKEVLKHEAWTNLVAKDVLQEYVPICFKLLKDVYSRTEGMRFWLRNPEEKDTLRSVYVSSIDGYSYASGNDYLND